MTSRESVETLAELLYHLSLLDGSRERQGLPVDGAYWMERAQRVEDVDLRISQVRTQIENLRAA